MIQFKDVTIPMITEFPFLIIMLHLYHFTFHEIINIAEGRMRLLYPGFEPEFSPASVVDIEGRVATPVTLAELFTLTHCIS